MERIAGEISMAETSGEGWEQRNRAGAISISQVAVPSGLLCGGPWQLLPLRNSTAPVTAMNVHCFNSRRTQSACCCGPQQFAPQRILAAFATEVTKGHHCHRLPREWDAAETFLQEEATVVPRPPNPALMLNPRTMAVPCVPATRPQLHSHSTHAHAPDAGSMATPHAAASQTPEPLMLWTISCLRPWRQYHSMHTYALHPGSMVILQLPTPRKMEHCCSGCTCPLEPRSIAAPQVPKPRTAKPLL